MTTTQKELEMFRQALQKGSLQKVYRELISFMMNLRMRFVENYGEPDVSGMYQGYMDMTYFACFTPMLKSLGLKAAIVFN